MKIVVIGNGMFANIGSLHFRRRLPDSAEILVIGPESRGGMPVVGESIIETTAQWLENRLDLGPWLRENCYPKYALTYYFKLDANNPEDRRYSVHCNERDPDNYPPLKDGWQMKSSAGGVMARPPSWQLNRDVFDAEMRRRVDQSDGIQRMYGMVKGIEIDGTKGHTLNVELSDGGKETVHADWIIDATGRRTLLGKKLGIKVQSEIQRDSFWFRLQDFDRSILSKMESFGPMPEGPGGNYHYERYYSTHHFMGKGHWIWMIPLKSPEHKELASIGVSIRPDLYDEGGIRNIDDFLNKISKSHPIVTELVKSGVVDDTNLLRNYHYTSKQAYSADRWAVVGDAAYAPDALFSNGLSFGSIQLDQIGEMLAKDAEGDHDPEYIDALDKAFWGPLLASQESIARWYENMHDPYLSALRLNWIEIAYFYLLLPLVMNRAHFDPKMMSAWKVLQLRQDGPDQAAFDLPKALLDARALFDEVRPEHFIYRGKIKVNPRAMDKVDLPEQLTKQMLAGSRVRKEYVADAVARVRIAESLPTDRDPEVSK